MKITVSVTEADIDLGKRLDCWECPIARAMFRATGERYIVDGMGARVIGDRSRRVSLPDVAIQFIREFDSGNFPKPFEFEVEVDRQWLSTCEGSLRRN
jgi:hypothetical protein